MIVPDVAGHVARARRWSDEAERLAVGGGHDAHPFQARTNGFVLEEQVTDLLDVAAQVLQPREEAGRHLRGEVEFDAAGPRQTAAEAVTGQLQQEVEAIAAHPAEVRRRRGEGDVAGQRAEIAEVVGQPFELESDAAHRL